MTKPKDGHRDSDDTRDRALKRDNSETEMGTENVPANEETEGATNALEAPLPPPEMAKDGKGGKS